MLSASMEDSKGNEMSFSDLKYPLMASLKLDGIRCLRVNGQTLSRSFKPIPNRYVQQMTATLPDGLDGELVTYNLDGTVRTFNQIQSDIMSEDGKPNFKFELFDFVSSSLDEPFIDRYSKLKQLVKSLPQFCSLVEHVEIQKPQELEMFENKVLAEGHEGVMVRRPSGPYKCGRATFKSQDLIKIKRFEDSEAEIIGFEERLHNENEATIDELGHTKRSSSKNGLVPANTMGTLLVRDIHSGLEFGIGTGRGLDDALRKTMWENKSQFIGRLVKYRYQKVGTKDLPRIPSFQGFRDARDM